MQTPAGPSRAPQRRRALASLVAGATVLATTVVAPTATALAADPAAAPAPAGWIASPGLTRFVAGQEAPTGTIAAPGVTAAPAAVSGQLAAPAPAGAFTAPPNTDFQLLFDGTVDPATRQVLQAAAGIWSAVLDVRVPIQVDARMSAMAPGMLGAAGPTVARYGDPGLPRPDVAYPVALANQLLGRDLDTTVPDIVLELSSTMTWDRATDGTVVPGGQSMLSVAVHELGHGLGHTSWVRPTSTGWSVTYVKDGVRLATPYDRLVLTGAGTPITSLPDAQVATAIASPLRWGGAGGRSANGGTAPALYSPPTFERGSSIGHLDEATFRSEVMTPFLGKGEVHTSIPAITRSMLGDIGWPTQTGSPAPVASAAAQQQASAYVDAVARDFVGRVPTATELTRWRDHLLGGGSRQDVARAYAFSDEWIGVLVDDLYRSTLGRAADPGGRAFWIGVLRAGQTPAQVAAQLYASPEYFRLAGGTTSAWISDLYAEILQRVADPAGLAYWVGRTAGAPRTTIAHELYQSLESRRDRVESLFRTLLGRAPDAGGWSYWAGVLSSGRDLDLAVFLAASDEYFARASQRA